MPLAWYNGRKCEDGCQCGRHKKDRIDICYPGCNCNRHTAPKSGEQSHNWVGDKVSRRSMHSRVERELGKASEYLCIDCESRPGHDWSQEPNTDWLDVNSYSPRCRSCHVKLDRNWEGSRK